MKNTSENSISNYTFSFSPDFPSKLEGITWCIAFVLEALLIVVGNLLTVTIFAVDKKLRKKSLLLVINMAFADLFFGGVFLPFYIYSLGNYHKLWTTRLSTHLHIFSDIILTFFSQVAILSAALISCERFYAVYWPLKHRTLSLGEYCIVICLSWALGVLVSTIVHFLSLKVNSKKLVFILTSYYSIFFFIVCSCNIGIWRKFQYRNIALKQQKRAPQNQRLTKTLLFVAIFGLMAMLPLVIVYFLMSFYEVSIHWRLTQMVEFLCFSNSAVNPIVYALRIPEFRQALGLCCFRRQAVITTDRDGNKKPDDRAAALVPVTPLRRFQTDLSQPQLAWKQEVIDTKL